MRSINQATILPTVLWLLAGCSGGGTDNNSGPDDGSDGLQTVSEITIAPTGEITHYGAVSVADDAGFASDIVGSFYRLERGVSAEFLNAMLAGNSVMCQVQNDDTIDFEEISAGFIPTIPGVRGTAVSAGEAIVLSGSAGTYATLQEQPAAGFLFYDLPNMAMLMSGPIPNGLTVDVTGSSEIAAISSAAIPSITVLSNATPSTVENISVNTNFSWDPSNDPNAMIRIFTSTAGGFFLEDGITVTCVVPDTGSFNFPAATRALLGSDFNGSSAVMSRIVVNPIQLENTVLYIIRESFR